MKAALAAMICVLIALRRSGISLEGDVVFTGVIGEEDGSSLGTLHVIEHGPIADMVVVGEPTNLHVAIAHRGLDYVEIEVNGMAAHSSQPESGRNAIYDAAAVVEGIKGRLVPLLKGKQHPLIGSPTVNVSAINGFAKSELEAPPQKPRGGTVPDSCKICLDFRRLPGSDLNDVTDCIEELLSDLRKTHPEMQVRANLIPACPELLSHPPLNTDPSHELVREALRIASLQVDQELQPIGVPFWSDAALFSSLWNVPAIVLGPGDIGVAHSDHEWVAIDQIILASRIYSLLALSLAGKSTNDTT
jgi:acetylornithine deacetylase/succinyl-diaminopimelate desuccinylase